MKKNNKNPDQLDPSCIDYNVKKPKEKDKEEDKEKDLDDFDKAVLYNLHQSYYDGNWS